MLTNLTMSWGKLKLQYFGGPGCLNSVFPPKKGGDLNINDLVVPCGQSTGLEYRNERDLPSKDRFCFVGKDHIMIPIFGCEIDIFCWSDSNLLVESRVSTGRSSLDALGPFD